MQFHKIFFTSINIFWLTSQPYVDLINSQKILWEKNQAFLNQALKQDVKCL